MLEVALRFGSYKLLGLFLLAGTAGILCLLWLLPRLEQGRRLAAAALALLVVHLGVLAAWAATVRVDSDEVEHLHCAWLVWQGLVPFRDFWQAHSPLLWYLLAPLVAQFHSPAVLIFSRVLAIMLFVFVGAATGLLAWRVFRDRATAVLAALVVVALGVRLEAAWLRPDQLGTLLVLVSLAVAGSTSPSRSTSLLAGVVFGLALALTPKPFLAALACPLAILLSPGFPRGEKFSGLLFYLFGGIAGAAPLLALLIRQGILSDWITWTFLHHASQGRLEAGFPAALALVAALGCATVLVRARNGPTLLLTVAFLLQTVGSALIPYRVAADLMLWVALAAIFAARVVMEWIRSMGQATMPATMPVSPALLAAVFVVLLEIEALAPMLTRRTLGDFSADRARLAWMMKQAGDGPVVLITPVHTIFSRDATRLYHLWQYSHWIHHPQVSASLAGFAQQLLNSRPALIAAAPRRITDDPEPQGELRPRLFQTLFNAGIITSAEGQVLLQFVSDNYEVRQAAGEQFYVRIR